MYMDDGVVGCECAWGCGWEWWWGCDLGGRLGVRCSTVNCWICTEEFGWPAKGEET